MIMAFTKEVNTLDLHHFGLPTTDETSVHYTSTTEGRHGCFVVKALVRLVEGTRSIPTWFQCAKPISDGTNQFPPWYCWKRRKISHLHSPFTQETPRHHPKAVSVNTIIALRRLHITQRKLTPLIQCVILFNPFRYVQDITIVANIFLNNESGKNLNSIEKPASCIMLLCIPSVTKCSWFKCGFTRVRGSLITHTGTLIVSYPHC